MKMKVKGKEVETEKADADEYETYKQLFADHPTFKSTPVVM